jgi:hypothetical protein
MERDGYVIRPSEGRSENSFLLPTTDKSRFVRFEIFTEVTMKNVVF